MSTILGLAGSLRRASYNRALLRAAAELAPAGCAVEVGDIRGIPLYDGDQEAAEGVPAVVEALKARIVAADALLLVTPEYNHSIPGVFKNAIDWLSRPPKDIARVFRGRRVAIMGASPGRMGTVQSQQAWLPVLQTLGTVPWFGGSLMVSGAGSLFAEVDGVMTLTDEASRKRVADFMAGFAAFLGR